MSRMTNSRIIAPTVALIRVPRMPDGQETEHAEDPPADERADDAEHEVTDEAEALRPS